MQAQLSQDGKTLSIRIPYLFQRTGGRRTMIVSDGSVSAPERKTDVFLLKALARAHRWQRMLESGEVRSMRELAREEGIDSSFLAKVLRLTLLAPDIVEAILDGRQPDGLSFRDMVKPFPVEGDLQREHFGMPNMA